MLRLSFGLLGAGGGAGGGGRGRYKLSNSLQVWDNLKMGCLLLV